MAIEVGEYFSDSQGKAGWVFEVGDRMIRWATGSDLALLVSQLQAQLSAAEVARDAYAGEVEELAKERDSQAVLIGEQEARTDQLRAEVEQNRIWLAEAEDREKDLRLTLEAQGRNLMTYGAPRYRTYVRVLPDRGERDNIEVLSTDPLPVATVLEVVSTRPAQELSAPASEAPRPSQEEAPATGSAGEGDARVLHGWGCRHRSALKPCTIFPVHAYESACEWARAYDCEVEPWYGHEPAPPAPDNVSLKQRVFTALGERIATGLACGETIEAELVAQFDLLGRDL